MGLRAVPATPLPCGLCDETVPPLAGQVIPDRLPARRQVVWDRFDPVLWNPGVQPLLVCTPCYYVAFPEQRDLDDRYLLGDWGWEWEASG